MENENEVLKNKLKDANIRGEKLARGWFYCVRHMCSFSQQSHNMAVLSYVGGQEVLTDGMRAEFVNIEGIAQRLKSIGARLETKLEKIRKNAREGNSNQSVDPMVFVNDIRLFTVAFFIELLCFGILLISVSPIGSTMHIKLSL